ncbi:MAG: acyl carrier protein [Alistipes sp.]
MSSKEQIVEQLTKLLAEEFEVEVAEIMPSSSLKDTFGFDSLDLVDVVVLIHQNFGIKLMGPDFVGIKTFGEFCNLIITKLDEPKS